MKGLHVIWTFEPGRYKSTKYSPNGPLAPPVQNQPRH